MSDDQNSDEAFDIGCAESINAERPSFEIPSLEARESLHVGDHAKLLFRFETGPRERMWVRVMHSEPGHYEGTLDNIPLSTAMVIGDHVVFEPRHVVDILRKNGERPALN